MFTHAKTPSANARRSAPQGVAKLCAQLSATTPSDEVASFPLVPIHQNLPPSGAPSLSDCLNTALVSVRFSTRIEELFKMAK